MKGRCPARPAEAIHGKGRLDGIEKGSEQRHDMIRRRDAQLEKCVKSNGWGDSQTVHQSTLDCRSLRMKLAKDMNNAPRILWGFSWGIIEKRPDEDLTRWDLLSRRGELRTDYLCHPSEMK
jgi:hypothetical protein